jgi:pilus assembly protein CpaE
VSRVVAFFSPVHAGATTLLLQTALRLAARRPRLRIIALDLNLQTPSLALHMGLLDPDAPARGLATLLPRLIGQRTDHSALTSALVTHPRHDRLQVLPGILDLLQAERVTPGAVAGLLAEARRMADLVLVDTTPTLTSPGCLPVLTRADRTLLITGATLADRLHTRRHAQVLLAGHLGPTTLAVVTGADGLHRNSLTAELELPVAALLPADPARVAGFLSGVRQRRYQAALDQVTALAYPAAVVPRPGWLARLGRRREARP